MTEPCSEYCPFVQSCKRCAWQGLWTKQGGVSGVSDNWMNKAERRKVHSMGAQLVSRVYAHWSDLPDRPFRLLTHMALVCKDATPKPTYWGGRDAMCQSLGLPIGADSSHQMVKRAIRRLTDSGAIKRVREGHAGARSEYELTLARGYSSDPLRGNSDDPPRNNLRRDRGKQGGRQDPYRLNYRGRPPASGKSIIRGPPSTRDRTSQSREGEGVMSRRIPSGSVEVFLEARALLGALGPDIDADKHWIEMGREIGAICTSCDDQVRAGGFCQNHYRRHLRAFKNQAARINHEARKASAA